MSDTVLDASAILALINAESGSDIVAEVLAEGALISSVNFGEVAAKLYERGFLDDEVRLVLQPFEPITVPFNVELAFSAASLRAPTRHLGLSFGDRACLALARSLNLPVLTGDRSWSQLNLGVPVRLVR